MRDARTRIGCLGLAANPPHIGHYEMAVVIAESAYVDRVIFVPTFSPPWEKEDMVSWAHRLAMCRLLAREKFVVSTAEARLGGVSYTINTLRAFQKERPSRDFFWCVGSDVVKGKGYLRWHQWKMLSQNFSILVVDRPGYALDGEDLPDCFIRIRTEKIPDISSTQIRHMVRDGKDIEPYVGKDIAEYIEKHRLYR